MEFKDIVMQRYATKQFDGRIVEEQKLFALLDLIRFSPSAFNLQPWKVKVVTATKIKAQLRPFAHDQPQITSCSHLLVFCTNTELEKLAGKVIEVMNLTGLPEDDIRRYDAMIREYIASMGPEQRLGFAREQVHIALANAVNGAKSLGLDSCPMGGFEPAAFSEVLFLPEEYVPVVLCAIGYAADTPYPKWRLPREEIFF